MKANGVCSDNRHSFLATFRKDLMSERAMMYDESINERVAYLDRCVAFIEGTKMKMNRTGIEVYYMAILQWAHAHALTPLPDTYDP